MDARIKVEGLREARRGLRTVNAQKALSKAHRRIVEPVQRDAQQRWRQQRIRPSVARSVIGRRATQTAAELVLKYGKHPYAAGVEFGALQYRQFPRWVGNRWTGVRGMPGHVIAPAIAEAVPKIRDEYADTVIDEYRAKLKEAAS